MPEYTKCSGCGLMFATAELAEFDNHDCDTDEALFLSTDEGE